MVEVDDGVDLWTNYKSIVDEERREWQPRVDEEDELLRQKVSEEEAKRKKWRQALHESEYPLPAEGVILHTDSSRIYNQKLLRANDDREWKNTGQYVVTTPLLVEHLLRFLDVSMDFAEKNSLIEQPTLFKAVNYDLEVNKKYTMVEYKRNNRYLHRIGLFYLETRLQLDLIHEFTRDVKESEAKEEWIPFSLKELASFCFAFLLDHHKLIVKLRQQNITDVVCLARLTVDLRKCVDAVYNMVQPLTMDEPGWNHMKVDRLWSHLFSFTAEPLVVPEAQTRLLREMQNRLLTVFLTYADHLYSFGRVSEMFAKEFMFYQIPDKEGPLAIALRKTSCSLFASDSFLSSLLVGAQTRYRLRPLDQLDREFTRKFWLEIAHADIGNGPLSELNIITALHVTARQCTSALSEQFMAMFTENDRLALLLSDIKSIYSGDALFAYASRLRRGVASRAREVHSAFQCSLDEAGIPANRRRMWTINHDARYGTVVAVLDYPLSFVAHSELIDILGECRFFLLKVLRARDLLTALHVDNEHVLEIRCIRPLSHLLYVMLKMITVIAELFCRHVKFLIDMYFEKINASKTVDSAIEQADKLTGGLRNLVGRHGVRKFTHALVDKLCETVDDIQLMLVCNTVTKERIDKWMRVCHEERLMMIELGPNCAGTPIETLAIMLQ